MNRMLTTLTAATAVIGVGAVAPTSAERPAPQQVDGRAVPHELVGLRPPGEGRPGLVADGRQHRQARPHRQERLAVHDVQLHPGAGPADAVVLDARSDKRLGGTGQVLPWNELETDLARDRGSSAVVLAGGLKPGNVAAAIRTLGPDVVDVSSGVEHSPGIKDHDRMRAFRDAVDASVRT